MNEKLKMNKFAHNDRRKMKNFSWEFFVIFCSVFVRRASEIFTKSFFFYRKTPERNSAQKNTQKVGPRPSPQQLPSVIYHWWETGGHIMRKVLKHSSVFWVASGVAATKNLDEIFSYPYQEIQAQILTLLKISLSWNYSHIIWVTPQREEGWSLI